MNTNTKTVFVAVLPINTNGLLHIPPVLSPKKIADQLEENESTNGGGFDVILLTLDDFVASLVYENLHSRAETSKSARAIVEQMRRSVAVNPRARRLHNYVTGRNYKFEGKFVI